jgi:HEPN domain-containing protein
LVLWLGELGVTGAKKRFNLSCMAQPDHVELGKYSADPAELSVYCVTAKPLFAPIDVNLAFLAQDGWSASGDRLRFNVDHVGLPEHPLVEVLASAPPHLFIRRFDREEDCLAVIRVFLDGTIQILSNDINFANRYLRGAFLEGPPSFHTQEEIEIGDEWIVDGATVAMFAGLVAGAFGWDSFHNIPPALKTSLEEARKALSIANYRSCVVMCRRSLEALFKFAFPRLLGREPGRMMLNALIQEFRNANPKKIPDHLLHIADSLRVLGNVPGAHAAEIENYRFSRFDAEFAIGAVGYFVDQYFSKIDTEVGQYYTLKIDLNEPEQPKAD